MRRLDFVIAALSWWYDCLGLEGYPTREQLDTAKGLLYNLRNELRDAAERGKLPSGLTDDVRAVFARGAIDSWVYDVDGGPEQFVSNQRDRLNNLEAALRAALDGRFSGFGHRLFRTVHEVTAQWSPACRKDLLVRYLGFPFWDVLLYPIQSV